VSIDLLRLLLPRKRGEETNPFTHRKWNPAGWVSALAHSVESHKRNATGRPKTHHHLSQPERMKATRRVKNGKACHRQAKQRIGACKTLTDPTKPKFTSTSSVRQKVRMTPKALQPRCLIAHVRQPSSPLGGLFAVE